MWSDLRSIAGMPSALHRRSSAQAFKRSWVRACRHALLAVILALVLAAVTGSSTLDGRVTHSFGKCAWIAVTFFTVAFAVTSARDDRAGH